MKKLLLLSFITTLFMLASCEKTETFDDTRKIDNETQFAKISSDSKYKKIESKTKAGYIMYKVLEEGTVSDVTPLFTDEVKINYSGWFKNYWFKDGKPAEDQFMGDNGVMFKNKIVFDTTETDEGEHVSRNFKVNGGLVDGFSTALQHMNVGDKWEVWIPWNMGYGIFGQPNAGIQGYTTLVFEIELKEII